MGAAWNARGGDEALNKAVRDACGPIPKVKQRFQRYPGEEIPLAEQQTARWLADFQKAEIDKWVPLMKAAKVKTD